MHDFAVFHVCIIILIYINFAVFPVCNINIYKETHEKEERAVPINIYTVSSMCMSRYGKWKYGIAFRN